MIYTIAHYKVKPEAINKVKKAIRELVNYVSANEPATRMYTAWQQKDDPTRFVHFFISPMRRRMLHTVNRKR